MTVEQYDFILDMELGGIDKMVIGGPVNYANLTFNDVTSTYNDGAVWTSVEWGNTEVHLKNVGLSDISQDMFDFV